jgi:hypothetical protein
LYFATATEGRVDPLALNAAGAATGGGGTSPGAWPIGTGPGAVPVGAGPGGGPAGAIGTPLIELPGGGGGATGAELTGA